MSTRFYRDVKLENDETVRIELIRDGFNVWQPDDYKPFFAAMQKSNWVLDVADTEWQYHDNSNANGKEHKAIFMNESDVTDYMFWRIEKYLNRINREAVETKETDNGTN